MQLTTIEDFKSIPLGTEIYAIPTGNNARRWDGEYITFKLTSVKRKYIGLTRYSREAMYVPSSGATKQEVSSGYGNNAGYKFFGSEDSIARYVEISKKRGELTSTTVQLGFVGRLTDEQVLKILDILEEKQR